MKRLFAIAILLFFGFYFISFLPSKAEAYVIKWSPWNLQEVIQAGETSDLTISFISSERVENVNLLVDQDLQSFVSVSPNNFSVIEPNTSYDIALQISVPAGTEIGLYDGNIILKSGRRTYPQPFKINLKIGFDEMSLDFSESKSLPHLTNDQVLFENVKYDNDRYILTMKWDNFAFQPSWMQKLYTVEIPYVNITIDGNDNDWVGILPVLEDPPDDKSGSYSSSPGTDLANLYVARDKEYLYFMMTLHDGDPQRDVQYTVEFQQYLNQLHTPGDRYVVVNNYGDGWLSGMTDRTELGNFWLNFTDPIGIGSGMLEWRIPIAAFEYRSLIQIPAPYFPPSPQEMQGVENRFIRTFIHPFTGNVSDENDFLTRPMIINFNQ